MILGYARVSTREQSPDLQLDALRDAGAERVWVEVASGRRDDRPELADLIDHACSGDTLAVWRLDRLGRSVQHLARTVEMLGERGIEFRSLTEGIDTRTAGGRLVFHLFASVAQFEADLTRERTRAGLAAARERGRVGGRPRALDAEKEAAVTRLLAMPGATVSSVARTVGVSRATIYRYRDSGL